MNQVFVLFDADGPDGCTAGKCLLVTGSRQDMLWNRWMQSDAGNQRKT
jgi:hypothetical protein